MEPPDPLQTKALDAVRVAHPGATDLGVTATIDTFLDGTLFVITFRTASGQSRENYVYLTSGSPMVCQRPDELARYFSGPGSTAVITRLARGFTDLGGLAGLIALIIAACVCYTFTQTPDIEVPDFLSHILTSFISFYMGNKFSKST